MIPQTLTLKGLYSYQDEQHIDFNHLLEGQLFGIFGSVGSGKSTILEAITFALYGETDRLNSRENRNYNMMNLKSDELWIDYTFINHDQKEYRFTVHSKRNSKDFENVRTYQRKAYTKVEDEWVPVEVTLTPEITGLTYQNFRRTIIIPQGKFQEFLQLTDKERTDMMKELFNLDKYEFFGQTTALENRNKEQVSILRGKLSHYDEISREAIEEKKKAAAEVSKKLQTHIHIRKEVELKVQRLEKLRDLFEDLKKKQASFKLQQHQKPVYDQRKSQLLQFEKAQRDFGFLLSRIKEISADLDTKQNQLTESGKLLEKQDKEKERLGEVFAKAEKEYQQLDHRKEELNDLKEWKKVLEANEAIENLAGRIANGESKIEEVEKQADEQEKKKTKLETDIEKVKKDIPDQNILMQVREWFAQKRTITEKQAERRLELTEKKQQQEQNKKELWQDLPKEFKEKMPEEFKDDIRKIISWFTSHLKNLEEKSKDTAAELEHIHLQSRMEEFANELKEGQPCPLCGSESHPNILDGEDVSAQKAEAQKHRENLEALIKKCNHALSNSSLVVARNKDLAKQQQDIHQKLLHLDKELEKHLNAFVWEGYNSENEQQVMEQVKQVQALSGKLKLLEEEKQSTERASKDARERMGSFEDLLTDIRNQKLSAETSKSNALDRLQRLKPEELPADEEALKQKTALLNHQVSQTEQDYKALEQQLQKIKDAILQQKTHQSHLKETVKGLEERMTDLEAEKDRKLKSSDFQNMSEVEKVLQQDINIQEERNEVEQFYQRYFAAEEALQEVQTKASGQSFNIEIYEKAKQNLEELNAEEEELKNKKVTVDNELKQLTASLEEKKTMEQELQQLEKRAENLRTMKQLFKGSGFVNYVSSVYLQNLCDAANERFYKLTRQQLQLETDENNNFRVRDYLNNGHTRSVKTLSGGQTFQASLSLALALAGSVQQQTSSNQNFFFLDEGFGTLDRESLQTVFDTLKSLRHENRIVGVISHVEEMQQEIDMFVKVTKDDEHGSKVKGSWE